MMHKKFTQYFLGVTTTFVLSLIMIGYLLYPINEDIPAIIFMTLFFTVHLIPFLLLHITDKLIEVFEGDSNG